MFTKLRRPLRKLLTLGFLLTGAAILLEQAAAQIPVNPDRTLFYDVIQKEVRTGIIFVGKGQDPCRSIENWFLFEDYVYPSASNGASFTVQPPDADPPDLDADPKLEVWLRRMWAEHPDGTHIEVFSAERREGCQ